MKIECINGYYKFYPESAAQTTLIEAILGVKLAKIKDFYTFEALAKVSNYSIAKGTINGIRYNTTFAGTFEDVMLANGFTYNITAGSIVLVTSIIETAEVAQDQLKYATKDLLQAYAKFDGKKIQSFTCFYNFNDGYYSYDRLVLI